jgi:hypothetical protein
MKPISAELRASNKTAYRTFLSHTVLRAALCALLLSLAPHARAESTSLPSAPAPVPQHVFSAFDYGLVGGLVAGRSLDWVTTTDCLRHPACKEEILPSGLAHSRVGLATFELGAASVEILSMYELRKHGYRRLARTLGVVDVALLLGTDMHNHGVGSRSAR